MTTNVFLSNSMNDQLPWPEWVGWLRNNVPYKSWFWHEQFEGGFFISFHDEGDAIAFKLKFKL